MRKQMRVFCCVAAVVLCCLVNKSSAMAYGWEGTSEAGDWKVYFDYDPGTGDIDEAFIVDYYGNSLSPEFPTELTFPLPKGDCAGKLVTVPIHGISWGWGSGGNIFAERNFTEITIPEGYTVLDHSTFSKCKALTKVTLPSTMESLKAGCFADCVSLTSFTFLGSDITLDEDCFRGCESLDSITLPDNLTTIPKSCFDACTSLTTVSFPKYLTTIESTAFRNCASLKLTTLPSTVVTINAFAFEGCHSMKTMTLPDSVRNINDWAFYNCKNLESITFSKNIINIPDSVLRDCPSLKSVTFYDKIITIGADILKDTPKLEAVNYAGTIADWKKITIAEENEALDKALIVCSDGKYHKVHVPVTDEAVAVTCTTDGKTEGSHCSVCGAVLVAQEVIAATGHSFATDYTVDKQATLTTDGSKSRHCGNCTEVTDATTIYAAKNISLSKALFTYTGKAQKVAVAVKDSQGSAISTSCYTVKFTTDKKSIGKHGVEVILSGDYTGSKTLNYTIIPKDIKIAKLRADKKGFTINWKMASKVSGYEIEYATNNKFNNAKKLTIKKPETTKTSVSKLKASKKYYVRLRSYKKVGNKKYYSNYSPVKTVTPKK